MMQRNFWRQWGAIVILAGAALCLSSYYLYSQWQRPIVINGITAPPLPTLDATRIAQGERLYAQHCASCHGANLEGNPTWKEPTADGALPPPPHDNNGHTWHHKDEQLVDGILNGGDVALKSKMPAFKDKMTREEVVATLEFIKSKWGAQEREFQWWITTVGDQQ